jgi:hypothetical protein
MNKLFLEDMTGVTIDKIPVGNWLVKYDDMKGIYYLEKTNSFRLPEKIYGDCPKYSERYLNSYNSWEGNLGVLLSGLKGTGKSLLAKKICIDSNLPVIMIPHPYHGAGFLSFLSKIDQDCIIFLDEFEKIYQREEEQNTLLSILDGTFNSKFLFLLTINEYQRMTQYMLNRPSRIHYFKEYKGMEEDLIQEICEDLLDDKSKIEDTLTVCTYIGEISMDILISLINEINLYPDERPMEVLDYMNLSPSDISYNVKVIRDGKPIRKDVFSYSSPLNSTQINLEWYGESIESMGSDEHDPKYQTWNTISFEPDSDDTQCTMKVKNGKITVEYIEEYDDPEDNVQYIFIYEKRKPLKRNYF